MEWSVVATLLLMSLGNLRAIMLDNLMFLAYSNELKNINLTSNTPSDDITTQVFFYLYTRCKPPAQCENDFIKYQLIPNSPEILKTTTFDPRLPTKILIHGFLDDSNKPMSQTIKNKILQEEDANVILVDWGTIAYGIDYIKIAKKTVEVGDYTGLLIDFLVEIGAHLDDFHLIGHSLGAHAAGFAGAAVKNGTIARITGLDPAKPGFHEVPVEKRLNPSNAKFVDCIHTCGGILGLNEAICTADFYPNGGKNMQPGCPFYDFGFCSHIRSCEYFAESINPNHKFFTQSCLSSSEQNDLICVPSTVKMGYYTTSAIGIFQGVTNDKYPFAVVF